ncbi:MAG: PAS domain-containing protein [Gammaproteobacteria bacterium]
MNERTAAGSDFLGNRPLSARIAAVYAFVATLWIVASDYLLERYVEPLERLRFSTYKGLVFVGVTSLVLYGLLRYLGRDRGVASMEVPAGTGRGSRTGLAYVIAVLLTLAMLVFRETLPPQHVLRTLMSVFLIPVTLGGLFGGAGPGFAATAVAAAGMLISDHAAIDQSARSEVAATQLTRFGLFLVLAIGSSLVCEALHLARRRAEALYAAQQRLLGEYRMLADQLPDYVWRKNLDGRYVSCNSRFAAMVDKPVAEVVGHTESELFFPADAARWHAEDLQVTGSGSVVEREQYWRTPHCEVGWVLVKKSPVYDEAGHCIGLIGVARDVTARRAAEEALRASERYLHALFDESIDPIATFAVPPDDGPMPFIDVNAAAERLLKRTREEVRTMTVAELLPTVDAARLSALTVQTRSAGHLHVELEVAAGDGTCIPIDVSVTLVHQREDGSHVAMAVARDLRKRNADEAERLRLQSQVIEMQKREAIGQLTGGIAHDFNNLLATVLGYGELASRRARASGDAKLEDYLNAIRIAGERGRDLVSKMLGFARSRPPEATERPPPLALRPVLEDSLRLLRATIPSSIAIELECDAELPPVQAERVDIEQIVMNLVINARDAMAGVGRLRIEVHGARHMTGTCTACGQDFDTHCVVLQVEDTGAGVPPALRAQVFQPFYTTKSVGEGSGLGLSVVHGIVHRHGGHILLGSGASGARFEVLLPLALRVDERAPPPPAVMAAARAPGRRVMIVDDELMLAEYWREVLSEVGYRVSAFGDGNEALAAFDADPGAYDAIVSDQTMPGLTGDALAAALRARGARLPIVLCTGYSARLDAQRAQTLELAAVLVKPVAREALLAVLEEAFAPGTS